MRLWSLHPKYLDSKGLVALWRESLLAQAVLRGETRAYVNHPQLKRFRAQDYPEDFMAAYLTEIWKESQERKYNFDSNKLTSFKIKTQIQVTSGQVEFEMHHLLSKLLIRQPALYEKWKHIQLPDVHPLFKIISGNIESWEILELKK